MIIERIYDVLRKLNNRLIRQSSRSSSQTVRVRIEFTRHDASHSRNMSTQDVQTDREFDKPKMDRFGGVTIHSLNQSVDDSVLAFAAKLSNSLAKWSAEGKRTVWFHVSRTHNQWLPVLCQNSFLFHHCSHDGDVVVMYRWLPEDKPSSVPPYAHTMVGVGGIVLNSRQELLVVLQRYGSKEILKLPGGYVEPHEDLSEAVVREIKEETGVETKFLSCVSFRHTHAANFDCSDLYFLAHLQPLTVATNDESDEVIGVQWISIENFLNHPKVHTLNRLFIKTFLENKKDKISVVKNDGLHPVTQKPYSFYRVVLDSSDSCVE